MNSKKLLQSDSFPLVKLVAILIAIVLLVCSNFWIIPGGFKWSFLEFQELMKEAIAESGMVDDRYTDGRVIRYGEMYILSIITLTFTIANLVTSIIGFVNRKSGDVAFSILTTIVSIFNFIFMVTYCLSVTRNYFDTYSILFSGVLIILLFLVAMVISILMLVEKMNQKLGNPKNTNNANATAKLYSLKKLLDSGAITQEEFDEKKKQLLGL